MKQNSIEKNEEIWKDVKGYEGLYQVSNFGRVKSLPRHRRAGNIFYTQKEHIMSQFDNSTGYKYVQLNVGQDKRIFFVHRLVATAFIPNPQQLKEVNHKNEIKSDNYVENLEWCTHKYNQTYGTKIERTQRTRKLLDSEQKALRKKNLSHSYGAEKPVLCYTRNGVFIRRFKSISQAARETGSCSSHISACCKGKRKSAVGYAWAYET